MVKESRKDEASGKGKTLSEKENAGNEGKNVTFVATPKTLALMEKAKANLSMNKVAFINHCIENYGPELLDGAEDYSGKNPPLSARLRYLEEAVLTLAYYDLISEWDGSTKTLKAHQDVLKDTNRKQWYNSKSLKEILAAAKGAPETRDTRPYQWQTLLRRREEFLALSSKEFLALVE